MICQVDCAYGPCDEEEAKEIGGVCCLMCFTEYHKDCEHYKECISDDDVVTLRRL